MPPKKRAAPAGSAAPKAARRSALAKEHNITNEEEAAIKEAFAILCTEKNVVNESQIPTDDVQCVMKALDLQPTAPELAEIISILDPEDEGFTMYSNFLAICAIKLQHKERNSEASKKEAEDAFKLFASGGEERITLGMLKRVAQLLKEDVSEEMLKDMILEANGGAGVGVGVGREEFEVVMRRAGIWR
ncbi:calmodulin [Calycina marina]|uniref:Calmodulin n=1 Tax=Calycina marina TaxID=1763456 RepID=A0A9P8CHL3_9HELO|nr:calmodulin [Calycina marina]